MLYANDVPSLAFFFWISHVSGIFPEIAWWLWRLVSRHMVSKPNF